MYTLKILLIVFVLSGTWGVNRVGAQTAYEVDWQYSGEIAVEAFGWSMCNAGDVNGDGYDDMLVAAIDHSDPIETEEEEGKLYLFYGGPDGVASAPNWSYEPNDDFTICGFDVSGGDLNGDGYSDIVAGNLQWAGDQIDEGKITLWYGGPDGPGGEPDWIFEGDQDYGLMGSSVALNGDINADGYADLFIAAKMHDNGEMDEGKVWMFWGSAGGPVGPVWSYEPNQATAIAGFPTCYAGDVNGDGFDDVIIGVNGYTQSAVNQGMAVLFHGSATGLSASPDWTAFGQAKKDFFGHWVDGAGDVNGDGYDDVIVSAILHEEDSANFNEGAVYCYLGSPTGVQDDFVWKATGNSLQANFGYCISGAGDVNGDGYEEIIVGAKYYSNPENKEGSVYLYFGGPEGPETDYCWFAEGGQDSAYLGRHVDGDADFNGDGYSDFFAGAYRYSHALFLDGIVYAMYGGVRESDFTYEANSYCQDDADPTATLTGWPGGTFTAAAGLVFADAATGTIDLSATLPGEYIITYTSANDYCNPTSEWVLSVGPAVNAGFSYPGTFIPIDGPNPSPSFAPGASAGVFSATPAGLVFTSIFTGEINLDASVPGVYTVTNTVSNPYCTGSYEVIIEILPPCEKPAPPVLDAVSPTTATIVWPAAPFVDEYYVYVVSIYDTIELENYPDTVLYLTDLVPATNYRTFIASYCGSELSPKSDNLDFSTQFATLENMWNEAVLLYPVPTSDLLFVRWLDTEVVQTLRLLDLQGRHMPVAIAQDEPHLYQLTVTDLPEGTYVLQIQTNSRWYAIPVVLGF